MKKYKAIFFDWDGTAVMSRKAPADDAVAVMKPLLSQGTKLIIVSGTTMENIAGGHIETYFSQKELSNLYLGLGRGAYNYAFRDNGEPYVFADEIPKKEMLKDIHKICFDIHLTLLDKYGFETDIIFSRPNYCKIDLMVYNQRGDNLFMQENELELLKESLVNHGIKEGVQSLIDLSCEVGKKYGIEVVSTCDAKYLEVGVTSKSHNVNTILQLLEKENDIHMDECVYWGDEYVGIEDGIFGSDSFMMTEKSRKGGMFFDVSSVDGQRPDGVKKVGGGVNKFLSFLSEQATVDEFEEVRE